MAELMRQHLAHKFLISARGTDNGMDAAVHEHEVTSIDSSTRDYRLGLGCPTIIGGALGPTEPFKPMHPDDLVGSLAQVLLVVLNCLGDLGFGRATGPIGVVVDVEQLINPPVD